MKYDWAMLPFRELREQTNTIGIDFLLTDISTAHVFLDVAETTGVEENRKRNRANAQLAYDTVLRLLPRVTISAEQKRDFSTRLEVLRKRLVKAGTLKESK
jgi:hypothetical protein